jgi:Tfp pilus assembly PilM family ATPase
MSGKSKLGIYLSSKRVTLMEVRGKRIIKKDTLVFKEKEISETEAEIIEKLNSLQEALREIKTRDCFIGLPSGDLIIRSFVLPSLPSKEIPQALNFEVVRYIPFPLEELIYDFQYREDKSAKKIEVVFSGIKKGVFKQYNSIFEKIGLKVLSLEPGAFSILRLLRYRKKINEKSSFGLIDVNGEEANFSIILNGFPFFNSQIKVPTLEEKEIFFKFYSEVKISLDYFRRQFPGRDIEKIFLLKNLHIQP